MECAICYRSVELTYERVRGAAKVQYHLIDGPNVAYETMSDLQESIPRFVLVQMVQLVTLIELSTVSSVVLN